MVEFTTGEKNKYSQQIQDHDMQRTNRLEQKCRKALQLDKSPAPAMFGRALAVKHCGAALVFFFFLSPKLLQHQLAHFPAQRSRTQRQRTTITIQAKHMKVDHIGTTYWLHIATSSLFGHTAQLR